MRPEPKKVVILSDLWGFRSDFPLEDTYRKYLPKHWKVEYFDSTLLGDIPRSITSQDEIHNHFVQGGIKRASLALSQQIKDIDYLIGLSIGGMIAWKSALETPPRHLICISATRLRKEVEKPNCPIYLFYGEHDVYKPSKEWVQKLAVKGVTYIDGGHDIYKYPEVIKQILRRL